MPFNNYNEIATAHRFRTRFQKTYSSANSAAGRWHEFFTASGTPGQAFLSATPGVPVPLYNISSGALPIIPEYSGHNQSAIAPDTRHLLSASLMSNAAALQGGVAILCDFLVAFPNLSLSSPTPIQQGFVFNEDFSLFLPRYSSSEYTCLIASLQTATNAANTITAGVNGNAAVDNYAPETVTLGANPSNTVLSALFAGLADGATPFASRQSPDPSIGFSPNSGIGSIQSYTLSTSGTGTFCFFIVKPLLMMPISNEAIHTEREFFFQRATLPRIADGACLSWLVMPTGAMTSGSTIYGDLQFAWSDS